MPQTICKLEELPENGSKEFELNGERCFAVRQGDEVYLYRNNCPHIGLPLNLMPDQFLDYHKDYIQCTSHGALFDISTGLCVSGPCINQSLEPLSCTVENGHIVLSD